MTSQPPVSVLTKEEQQKAGGDGCCFSHVSVPRFCLCADRRAGSAHSSNQQADSDWAATLEYLEDGGSGQAESVPPLPEPLQPPARQVVCHDSLAATRLSCSICRDIFAFTHVPFFASAFDHMVGRHRLSSHDWVWSHFRIWLRDEI